MKVITVPFDGSFWNDTLLPACEKVFRQLVVPEILTGKLQQESQTKPLDIEKSNTQSSAATTQKVVAKQVIPVPQKNNQQFSKPQQVKAPARQSKRKNKSPHTVKYQCGQCHTPLPEKDHKADNSDASVGCDCQNCGCDVWFCWPCADYNEDLAENETD